MLWGLEFAYPLMRVSVLGFAYARLCSLLNTEPSRAYPLMSLTMCTFEQCMENIPTLMSLEVLPREPTLS